MKYDKNEIFELKNQILMAEALNRQELEPVMINAIQRYTGQYVPKFGYTWDIILNEVYPIIQTSMPSIFFRNPRAFAKPRQKTYIAKRRNPLTGKMEEVQLDSQKSANTQEGILNYSIEKMKYKREVRKVLLDGLLFPHAVLWHGYKGDFGMTEEQSIYVKNGKVFVQRVNPMRFIKDPSVNMANLDEAQWVGRIIDVPFRDIVEDDKLNVDKNLKGILGYGDKVGTADQNIYTQTGGQDAIQLMNYKKNLLDYTEKDFQQSKYARFIRCFEIVKRPCKSDARKGKPWQVFLLTSGQTEPLRVDEWPIMAEGWPAKILSFNELNDAQFGLADVETYKDIADQKNTIVNLQLRNAQENSKVYVAVAKNGTDEESVEKIQKGDQTIMMFEGDTVTGKMSVQSGGGQASSELYLIDQRIQKNLDDKSGVTDLRRGVLQSGEESAFSVKQRAAGAAARPAYRQDLMVDFLKESLEYINDLNKQFMPIEEAVRVIGSLDLEWTDKPTKEEIQADVDIEIDPISMLPENPQDEIQTLQQVLNLLLQGLTNPAIIEKIKQEGKTINLSPLISQLLMRMKIKDPDIFRNIKPEEGMGYSSNQQLMAAKDNVRAALTGQPIPNPPALENDHNAVLTIYSEVQELLQLAGQQSDQINQLIQIHQALMQQLAEKEATPGAKLNKPTTVTL